ncbi:hypothetical protein OG229_31560 [Streptomyces platensis]|uniref:hypothetical protein n=1 Tax=Streptomyces platensis TaxID=58346 RepID=UPI002E0EE5C6|nr:hypothetical protein OG229_31560 [Streptomyces platensis]
MWRVGKSVQKYRNDPDWHSYRTREPDDWLTQFGFPGHPFGTFRNHIHHVLEGQVRGYPTTLFHLAGVRKGGRYGTLVNTYSVAVLTLPTTFPDTSVSVGTLVYRLRNAPLPPDAGTPTHLSAGRNPRMIKCSIDPAFAELVITEPVVRITVGAKMGWRLHRNHMLGWLKDRKPYEKVVSLAETMTDILAEFPASAEAWEIRDGRHG